MVFVSLFAAAFGAAGSRDGAGLSQRHRALRAKAGRGQQTQERDARASSATRGSPNAIDAPAA